MQIAYSRNDTQSILSIARQTALKKSSNEQNEGQRTTGNTGAAVGNTNSLNLSASALQASLSATALDQASNTSGSSRVINPIDYMTSSDVALWEKVTGGTIKDGKTYLPDGSEGDTQAGSDLIGSIYEMRAHGTFDSQGNRVALSGDITAEDLRGYIDHYRNGGWLGTDTSILDDTMKALAGNEA